jgi:hypothetical protein
MITNKDDGRLKGIDEDQIYNVHATYIFGNISFK